MQDPIWFRKGQDNEFSQWRNEHIQDGYVVNKDGPRWRIHTAHCDSIFTIPLSKGQSLTTYPKICSTNRNALREEAQRYGGEISNDCSYCHVDWP